MALDLKTWPWTDGQGGENVYVLVHQPSSVKLVSLTVHERIYIEVYFHLILY